MQQHLIHDSVDSHKFCKDDKENPYSLMIAGNTKVYY